MIRRRRGAVSNIPALAENMAVSESKRFSKPGLSFNSRSICQTTQSGGHQIMAKHASISPEEAADRLAIRELIEAYAHCADHRDAKGQMALFTPDAHFL